jgi:NRPS condensation-like uncharacterized protein
MTAGVMLPFDRVGGENFNETVIRINGLMNKFKNENACMYGLEFLRFVPFAMKLPAFRKKFTKLVLYTLTGFSNIGSITEDMANYDGLHIEDFYITGAIKYPPHTLLSLCTFRNRLYIFTTIAGSDKDVETGKRKLDLIKSYLSNYIE